MEIAIKAATFRRVQVAVIVVMIVLSAAGAAVELSGGPRLGAAGRLFSVDAEQSLPNWYSVVALAVSVALLAACASVARRRGDRDALAWAGLTAIFALLSLDEVAGVHEIVGSRLAESLHAGGWFVFGWVIPALVLVPAVGALFLPFLARLPSRRRNQFVTAGAIFVAGALVMEMIGGKVLTALPKTAMYSATEMMISPAYAVCFHIEEFFEMLGIALFNAALVEHLAETLGKDGLRIHFRG